jgi:hypothetical protein
MSDAFPPPSGVPADGVAPTPIAVVSAEPADRPQRSRGRTVVAVAGVVALVAAGAFAIVSISGNESAGGGASPTAVGLALTDALSNEDVLGVVDLLLPGERNTFRAPMVDAVDHLRRLGVVADDASLGDVGGVDIEFSDVVVTEEPTGADDIVNIVLAGSVTGSVDGVAVPLGDLIITDAMDGERPDMDVAAETSEFDDVRLTVVERDGRWYLSAFYTLAESIRDGGSAVPASGIPTPGADSPEAAMTAMLEAISDKDLGAALGMLDPEEFEALQRYAPLFLDEAQAGLDDVPVEWSISDVSVSSEGSGDRRTVDVTALTFTADLDGVRADIRYADGCYTGTVDGESIDGCNGDDDQLGSALGSFDLDDTDPSVTAFLDEVEAAFSDFAPSGVAVHRVGGRWYVSPMRTGFDLMNGMLAALDRDEASRIGSSFTAMSEWLSASLDDALSDGGLSDDGFSDDDAQSACYALQAPEGPQCMLDGIAAGTIDPAWVSVTTTHPECGVSDVYWDQVYSLPDDEFTAMITAASPCFVDLVARGEIEAFAVPYELLAPQCAGGLNIYTVTEEQSAGFYDCAALAIDGG